MAHLPSETRRHRSSTVRSFRRCRASPSRTPSATGAPGLPEVADVVPHLLGQIHLRLALLHVGPIILFHVVVIKYCRPRGHRREKRLELLDQTVVEHARFDAASYMLSSKMSQPVK